MTVCGFSKQNGVIFVKRRRREYSRRRGGDGEILAHGPVVGEEEYGDDAHIFHCQAGGVLKQFFALGVVHVDQSLAVQTVKLGIGIAAPIALSLSFFLIERGEARGPSTLAASPVSAAAPPMTMLNSRAEAREKYTLPGSVTTDTLMPILLNIWPMAWATFSSLG